MTDSRQYDVVLYGASGFVGRQTVRYFSRHAAGLRWALAGRDRQRLESVREAAGESARKAGILVAEADDAAALERLARATRVVLSTAGPYALCGTELVAACVRSGTHYVDITGETPWVKALIESHHEDAQRSGTRIVPCCGFDSVPSDLGAWLVNEAMHAEHGEACISMKACFSMRGGMNGGTLASLLHIMRSGKLLEVADPFLLNPPGTRPRVPLAHADPVVPHFDGDFLGWVGPFFMGPINTRVVRRSAALLGYVAGFHYQEFMYFGNSPAAGLAAGAVHPEGIFGALREMVGNFAPRPGQGPSEESMDRGSFRCELVGRSASGKVIRGRVSGQGDPGNRATTRFVCEAAMALADRGASLPGGTARGGVLTPASGIGAALVARLKAAEIVLEIHG